MHGKVAQLCRRVAVISARQCGRQIPGAADFTSDLGDPRYPDMDCLANKMLHRHRIGSEENAKKAQLTQAISAL